MDTSTEKIWYYVGLVAGGLLILGGLIMLVSGIIKRQNKQKTAVAQLQTTPAVPAPATNAGASITYGPTGTDLFVSGY